MMLKSILLAAGLALAAVSAQAATMKAVWTGTIVDDRSVSVAGGMFGYDDGTLLAGVRFTAEIVYDTSRGTRTTTATRDRVDYQTNLPVDSEMVVRSAKITMNGVSYLFPVWESIASRAFVDASGPDQEYFQSVLLSGTNPVRQLVLRGVFDTNAPIDLEAPVSLSFGTGVPGLFRFFEGGSVATGFKYTNAYASAETLTITPIPLPATLPLVLAALAGLGVVARRRRAA